MPYDPLVIYTSLVECIHCFIMQSKRRRVEAPRIREKYFPRDWGGLNISTGAKPFDTIYTEFNKRTATKSTAGSRPRFYQDVTFLRERSRKKELTWEEKKFNSRGWLAFLSLETFLSRNKRREIEDELLGRNVKYLVVRRKNTDEIWTRVHDWTITERNYWRKTSLSLNESINRSFAFHCRFHRLATIPI